MTRGYGGVGPKKDDVIYGQVNEVICQNITKKHVLSVLSTVHIAKYIKTYLKYSLNKLKLVMGVC